MARIKLGDLLVKAGVITEEQLTVALAEQKEWGDRLGDILERLEFITEDTLVRAIAKQTGLPLADLRRPIAAATLQAFPRELAEEQEALPLELTDDGKTLILAMSDPLGAATLEGLPDLKGRRVVPRLAAGSAIRAAIARLYAGEEPRAETHGPVEPAMPPPEPIEPINASRPAPAQSARAVVAARFAPTAGPQELLKSLELAQRAEVKVLKALVELLIAKGVFTRSEYVARLR